MEVTSTMLLVAGLVGCAGCIWLACYAVLYQPGKAKIKGSHILITGGSSGIGLATAVRCLKEGAAHVVIVGSTVKKLQAAEAELRALIHNSSSSQPLNQKVTAIACDVSKAKLVEVIQAHIQEHGPIDILVANAGVAVVNAFDEIPLETFERFMQVNYLGAVYSIRGVLPSMKARKQGRIIIVSSMLGQTGMVGFCAYGPTKFALRGLAESLSMELCPYRIGVTVVNPPTVDTPMYNEELKPKALASNVVESGTELFSADRIAQDLLSSVSNYHFFVQTGFEGALIGVGTIGMAPASSVCELLTQLITISLLRFVGLCYLKKYYVKCEKAVRKDN